MHLHRSGRTYVSGTILQATVVATSAAATTLVGVNLGVGLTVSGTSQTAIYSTNGESSNIRCEFQHEYVQQASIVGCHMATCSVITI